MRTSEFVLALVVGLTAMSAPPAMAQERFVDQLELDETETCATGLPEHGEVIALALRGAKNNHYITAGNSEVARLAVRGPVSTAFQVFQVMEAAHEGTIAIYSLGHQRFVSLDENTRAFATAEPAAATLLILEETDAGYFRIKLQADDVWMRMNVNGYLDFRTRDPARAVEFCAQLVSAG